MADATLTTAMDNFLTEVNDLPVNLGGTGANTATGARTNLDVLAVGELEEVSENTSRNLANSDFGTLITYDTSAGARTLTIVSGLTQDRAFMVQLGTAGNNLTIAAGASVTILGGNVTLSNTDHVITFVHTGTLNTYRVINKSRTRVKREGWIPAGAMTPDDTTGPTAGQVIGTNITRDTLDFDPASEKQAVFDIVLPQLWDTAVNIKMKFLWLTSATSGNAVWAVRNYAFADSDNADTNPAGEQTVTDAAQGTANYLGISGVTGSDITIQGSPAVGEMITFEIALTVSSTIASDARLLGVYFQIEESDTEPSAIS